MDSDSEMPVASDEEMVDDEDYYYYSDMGDDDDDADACAGGGGSSDEEVVAGDYEGQEAEGSDEVVSRREQEGWLAPLLWALPGVQQAKVTLGHIQQA